MPIVDKTGPTGLYEISFAIDLIMKNPAGSGPQRWRQWRASSAGVRAAVAKSARGATRAASGTSKGSGGVPGRRSLRSRSTELDCLVVRRNPQSRFGFPSIRLRLAFLQEGAWRIRCGDSDEFQLLSGPHLDQVADRSCTFHPNGKVQFCDPGKH